MLLRVLGVLLGIWLGAQLALGYVAAPVLFAQLPRMQAGEIAGVLFSLQAYFGLVVWVLAVVVAYGGPQDSVPTGRQRALMVLLWLVLALNEGVVTPVIAALKSGGSHVLLTLTGGDFGLWHGIASSLYLLASLLGLYLLARCLCLQWR